MAQNKKITLEEFASGIDKGLTTADMKRAGAFDQLTLVRQGKNNSLHREQVRLTEKYGTDHPRVALMLNKIQMNEVFLIQVAAETIRAKTEIPYVDPDTWVFHGFVKDKALQGVSNLTVALFDPNGARLNKLGHACTNANGYFKLASKNIDGGAAYVRVLSFNGDFLFVDTSPLLPKPGSLDYKEITLSGDTIICVPGHEPPTGSPGEPDDDKWIVMGRVTNPEGQGLSELIVSVFDKDLIFDDRLGQTVTDQNGYYRFSYRTSDFRDLIERKPDIYLKVFDLKGTTLYSTKGAIRYEAGRVERIDIVIAKQSASSSGSKGETAPLQTPSDMWVVNGHVTDAQGKPLVGYTVTAYDKDFLRDDRLGSTTTDAKGSYSLTYRTSDFRGFIERKPDIYFQVHDPKGTLVYVSKNVWFEAGRVETIDIVIGKR